MEWAILPPGYEPEEFASGIKFAGVPVYLAVVMDVFTRSTRGWFLSRRLDGDLTLMALKRALATAAPQIHHSDQGGQ